MPSGDEPVGRPSTNGFWGVGANVWMRSKVYEYGVRPKEREAYLPMM
jgi:hypothetical protein